MTPARENPQRMLLTVREVAYVLGCGRTLVYDLIGSRQLPIVKVGRLTRVPMAEVDNFVTGRLTTVTSAAFPRRAAPPPRRRRGSRPVGRAGTAQTALFDGDCGANEDEGRRLTDRRAHQDACAAPPARVQPEHGFGRPGGRSQSLR